MIQTISRAAAAVLSLYMLLIFIRVLLTWFSGARYGRAYEILASITDPYLNWFRTHITLQFGAMDFSPLVGILLLGVSSNIFSQLALAGTITFAYILAILISALWSVVSFFFTFFIIIGFVRLAGLLFRIDDRGRIWPVTEQLLNPLLQKVVRPFLRGRFTSYRDSIFIFLAVMIAVALGGRVLSRLLIHGVLQLPF